MYSFVVTKLAGGGSTFSFSQQYLNSAAHLMTMLYEKAPLSPCHYGPPWDELCNVGYTQLDILLTFLTLQPQKFGMTACVILSRLFCLTSADKCGCPINIFHAKPIWYNGRIGRILLQDIPIHYWSSYYVVVFCYILDQVMWHLCLSFRKCLYYWVKINVHFTPMLGLATVQFIVY